MGGLSPEYLEQIQRGLGGLGQGAMMGMQQKMEDQQRQEEIGMKAAMGGYQPMGEGQTAAFTAGGQGYVKSPATAMDKLELKTKKLEMEKLSVDIAHTKKKTQIMRGKDLKVDPGVRQLFMDYIKQTDGGEILDPDSAGVIKALAQKIGAPIDVVEEMDVPKSAKVRNWLYKAFKISPQTGFMGDIIGQSKAGPTGTGKFKIKGTTPLSSLSNEQLEQQFRFNMLKK